MERISNKFTIGLAILKNETIFIVNPHVANDQLRIKTDIILH